VTTGLTEVWQALALGRLKIFRTLQHFKTEYRVYRRDEHGKLVKKNDHLMDCMRYLWMTWDKVASLPKIENTVMPFRAADSRAGL
jgi:hypothetical protein